CCSSRRNSWRRLCARALAASSAHSVALSRQSSTLGFSDQRFGSTRIARLLANVCCLPQCGQGTWVAVSGNSSNVSGSISIPVDRYRPVWEHWIRTVATAASEVDIKTATVRSRNQIFGMELPVGLPTIRWPPRIGVRVGHNAGFRDRPSEILNDGTFFAFV